MFEDENDMSELSAPVNERSRKAHSLVLQRLAPSGKQTAIAASMGTSDATISRLLSSKDFERTIHLINHLGLKIVDSEAKTIDFSRYMVLQETYAKVFEYEKRTGKIFGDEEE